MWGLILSLTAGVVAIVAVRRLAFGYPQRRESIGRLSPSEVALLDSAAEAMYPDGGAIQVSARDADVPAYVDRWFQELHPTRRMQIRLLIAFFEHSTLIFPGPRGLMGFRRFSSQPLDSRIAILRSWHGSRLFARRLLFTAFRAVLTMGYLGHPDVLRELGLAPFDIESPVLEVDLLYPPIGGSSADVPYTRADLTPPSDGTPLSLETPLHPAYEEKPL